MSSEGPEFNPAMEPVEPVAGFDVPRTSERAGLLKLIVGFGLLVTLIFIGIKIYQPGVRDRGDPPLITAENTPFKIVPEDAGGLQTPDQDKEVFDVMAGEAPSTDVITLPPPEAPVDRPSGPVSTVDAIGSVSETQTDAGPSTATEPVINPTPPRPRVEPTPPPVIQSPVTTGSDWLVQVASLRSQAEAAATYDAIAAKHSAILSGFRSDIVRVDLAEKGIYYRARIAGFSDRDEASATCERLKAAGQSCFVARR